MDTTRILLYVLFGSIGTGYLVYGKRQQKGMALLAGAALVVSPYLISNTVLLLLVGIASMVVPFIFPV